jgi:hypothetical protein
MNDLHWLPRHFLSTDFGRFEGKGAFFHPQAIALTTRIGCVRIPVESRANR